MEKRANVKRGQPQRTSIFDTDVVKKPNASRNSMLSSLKATRIVASKPALPSELISVVLDCLPPAALIRCAQVSRKLKEMVYEDARWITRLQAMEVWNDGEARQRQDDALRRKFEESRRAGGANHPPTATLFDLDIETNGGSKTHPPRKRSSLADGFDDLTLSSTSGAAIQPSSQHLRAVTALKDAQSIYGQARQTYGKIHRALNPFYTDITKTSVSVDPMVFRVFHEAQQQAQVLSNLKSFGKSDIAPGWRERIERLGDALSLFQNRMANEFRAAYDQQDLARMRSCISVAVVLDGGQSAIDIFINSHPLLLGTQRLANASDCTDGVAPGFVDLGPSQRFFQRLAVVFSEQAELVDSIFPPSLDVMIHFLQQISDKVIQDFINIIFNATHQMDGETYLKAVPGVFEQCMRFSLSIQPTKASSPTFQKETQTLLLRCFEQQVQTYLPAEMEWFQAKAEEGVRQWELDLSEQESRNESFYMSNVNRQAAKRDFLSSFKKVVMMPVNAVAAFPLPGGGSKANMPATPDPEKAARASIPVLASGAFGHTGEAPTTELAAKAAIMNSRLEGIKTLFSIEVALNLVHLAKTSIERIAPFARHDATYKSQAAQNCETIFITLVQILGQRHIRTGFDKAVNHLTTYNPRDVKGLQTTGSEDTSAVEPLVTFLELVNVGDLIQQMVDVFYAQELVAAKLTDRDDFMNPATKEKKAFEQMLDERVAAGMSKGIDVLMGEVEYLCATTQLSSDYNPGGGTTGDTPQAVMDIGPSTTATQVVALVESHTAMLVGSTDKTMLDVFFQEVGLRLFGAICKHIKRQRISVDGAIKLISDINLYAAFIASLKQKPLAPYSAALRELAQLYLVDCSGTGKGVAAARAKELAAIIADADRYKGIFAADEVLEFTERRADWYAIRGEVERAMYGIGCVVM